MIGETLASRYDVLRELGRGGMGVVFLARDRLLEREVAVKLLPAAALGPGAQERFHREARILARMDHPNIVPLHDIAEHDGATFLVMPFVAGVTLRALLREHQLAVAVAVEIAARVAEALDYSHRLGVVHRDVKPENIMIEGYGRSDAPMRVRVTDFGIALAEHEDRVTRSGNMVGTASYLSPEQIADVDVDGRSDLYALGTVLYECLAGRTPFQSMAGSIYTRALLMRPRSIRVARDDVDPALDALVLRCLEKDPDRRPQSGGELAAELAPFFAPHASTTPTTDAADAPAQTPRPHTPGRPVFAGRDAELAELRRRLDAASRGECQLVLVSGETGMGKSRLLDELGQLAVARGICALRGRFYERDATFAYQGFCELFQDYFRVAPETTAPPADLSDLSSDLTALFPPLAEVGELRSLTNERDRARARFEDPAAVYDLLARTIGRIGGGSPLVLFLEDLHGADVSIDALRHVARRLLAMPTLIVGTFRSEGITARHPIARLLEEFRGQRRFAHLRLAPLPEEVQRELVDGLLGCPAADPASHRRLYETAEGNPFFATELVRFLADTGGIARDATGGWTLEPARLASGAYPKTVQLVIGERIERLPDDRREVLQAASVLGRVFAFHDLETLAGEIGSLDDLVDQLVEAGLLEERAGEAGDTLAFTTAVEREVVYSTISRRRKRALHRAYAQTLERRNASRVDRVLAPLVHHYALGGVPEKVVTYGLRLARLSLAAFSAEDAARAASTVLETLQGAAAEEPTAEGEARLLLARARRQLGDSASALEELAHAVASLEREGDPGPVASAYAEAAETAWEARRAVRTRELVARGLEWARAAGDAGPLARLLALGATAANLGGDTTLAVAFQAEADALEASLAAQARDGGTVITRRPGGLVVVPIPAGAEPRTLDPALCAVDVEPEYLSTVFETLTFQTRSAGVVPWLAEVVEAEDGARRFRFRLRKGVRFHDGRPLTARDVRSSLTRLLACSEAPYRLQLASMRGARDVIAGAAQELAGLRVVSDLELVVELEQPMAFFPSLLTNLATAIVPEGAHSCAEDARGLLVGTGPFRVMAFEPGSRIELEANPDYWREGFPRCEFLTVEFGVTGAEALAGLRSGRYSIAWDLSASDEEALGRDPELAAGARECPIMQTAFLALNIHRAPFDDEGVRRAILESLDVEAIVRATTGRRSTPAHGIIPPGLLGHEPDRRATTKTGARRVSEVQQEVSCLMRAAFSGGVFAGFRAALFEALAQLGLRARVARHGREAWDRARASAADHMFLLAWSADYPDPDSFTHGLLHTRQGWVGAFCGVPQIDRLLERGRSETDPDVRRDIYREVEDMVARRALAVPLFHPKARRFARPNVAGLEVNICVPYVSYDRLWVR